MRDRFWNERSRRNAFGGVSPLGAFAFAVGSLASAALAHGPQVQIGVAGGQIVTRALYPDGPYDGAVSPLQRVYEIPMAERSVGDANDGWYAQPNGAFPFTGPGIATALGGFANGSIISLGFADSLSVWDGVGFSDPGDEQIDAYRGSAHVAGAVTSDFAPYGSFSFTAISGGEDEHKTAFFRLLGDGLSPNTLSDDGVYLLSLELATDQLAVHPSDPYFFLLNKNASPADAAAALAYVNAHLVPEPATAVLLAVSGFLFISRRRRRGQPGASRLKGARP